MTTENKMLVMEINSLLIIKGDEFDWLQDINEDGYEFVLNEEGQPMRAIILKETNNDV